MSSFGKHVTIEDVYYLTQDVINGSGTKRVEESVKFIYKSALKALRSNFGITRLFQTNEDMLPFYKYYFGELAEKLNIPIKDFFDPLNNDTKFKTLSKEYLKKIFLSDRFKRDFYKHLDESLMQEYQSSIPNKILQIIKRFEDIFEDTDQRVIERGVASFRKYFRDNKQCKLPWMEHEIVESIKSFKFLIDNP